MKVVTIVDIEAGGWLAVPAALSIGEALDVLGYELEDLPPLTFKRGEMTKEEFDNLPEWDGF